MTASLAYALREKLISCKNNFKDISLKLTSRVRYGPSTPLLCMSKKKIWIAAIDIIGVLSAIVGLMTYFSFKQIPVITADLFPHKTPAALWFQLLDHLEQNVYVDIIFAKHSCIERHPKKAKSNYKSAKNINSIYVTNLYCNYNRSLIFEDARVAEKCLRYLKKVKL